MSQKWTIPPHKVRVSKRAKQVTIKVSTYNGLEVVVPVRFNKSKILYVQLAIICFLKAGNANQLPLIAECPSVIGTHKILGVTIIGNHAGELITEYVSAMKHGLGLNRILETIHIYPTMAEANKFAAGIWKKQHVSDRLLWLLKKFHSWRLHLR